jgi:hypothetical protein
MSCDHSTYRGDVIDVVRPASPVRELHGVGPAASLKRGPAAPIAEQVAAKAKRDAARSRSIPDSTQVDPEFVWGDEGPLND